MPTFPVSGPVVVDLQLAAGDATILASDRDDAVVEVVPRDPSNRGDVRVAEETSVTCAGGRLEIRGPRGFGWGRGGTVDVSVSVPSGSQLGGRTGAGALRTEGPLGDCTFKSGAGAIRLGPVGAVRLVNGAGDVSVEHAAGDATIKTGTGRIAVGELDGSARLVNGSGEIAVERVAGDLEARTGTGNVRVGAATSGTLNLVSGMGTIELGIAHGTAARLDLQTAFGRVEQALDPTDAPPADGPRLEVRGRTSFGDITVRRALAVTPV